MGRQSGARDLNSATASFSSFLPRVSVSELVRDLGSSMRRRDHPPKSVLPASERGFPPLFACEFHTDSSASPCLRIPSFLGVDG